MFSVSVPGNGGTLREGILGTPRFINPVLATSDIDQDITAMVYSGLMRRIPNPEGPGSIIIPDLAESYTVSPDGKTYTFILKPNAVFQDGKPVRASDVVFTIKSIQDSRFQSPLANDWLGISATATADNIVTITLPRAFSGFLETTTVGILPQHIWGNLSVDEFLASSKNNNPIGSGPYRVQSISHDKDGIAKSYTLSSFRKFTLGKPHISTIKVFLYPNEDALLAGYAQGNFDILANIHPYDLSANVARYTVTTPLPRMFGLFLNPSRNPVLADANLRSVIESAINPSEITSTVFQGYAQPITHPLPELPQGKISTPNISMISQKLDAMGWKLDAGTGIRSKAGKSLSFVISTADTAELKYTAQVIQKQLRAVGIATDIQIFQLADLETSVIKKRSFDALLFGQFIRSDADLYAFWHSSQKAEPGLNITGFSTGKLDGLIEKLFTTTDPDTRAQLLNTMNQELQPAPVIWLYQPDFVYSLKRPVYGLRLDGLVNSSERFANIYQWYLQTDKIWKVFHQ